MSGRYPPLTCAEVKRALREWGFRPKPGKRKGSHEQWVCSCPVRGFLKVTVDCPKAPFSPDLINSMARQAKRNKKDFYKTLKKGRWARGLI